MEPKGNIELKHIFADTVVAPKCNESGYTLHRCNCGYAYKSSFVPAAHDFLVTSKDKPTCTEGCAQVLACKNCDLVKTNWVSPKGHSWYAWHTRLMPTCLEPGVAMRMCRSCKVTEERPIPATGHKLTRPTQSKTSKYITEYFCENCGETVKINTFFGKYKTWILSVGAIALLGVLAAVLLK